MALDSQLCQEESLAWARNYAVINQRSIFDYFLGYSFIGVVIAPASYFITKAVMERRASVAEYAAIALSALSLGIVWGYCQFLEDTVQESNQGATQL